MNLWQVDDHGEPFDCQWCACFWAWGKDEALQMAVDAYEYPPALEGENPEEFFRVKLISDWPGVPVPPAKDYPHEECRYVALRQAGWMDEGDNQCEACGLYPMGLTTFCEACWCCGQCCYCEDL